jgi:hypothetical protein
MYFFMSIVSSSMVDALSVGFVSIVGPGAGAQGRLHEYPDNECLANVNSPTVATAD